MRNGLLQLNILDLLFKMGDPGLCFLELLGIFDFCGISSDHTLLFEHTDMLFSSCFSLFELGYLLEKERVVVCLLLLLLWRRKALADLCGADEDVAAADELELVARDTVTVAGQRCESLYEWGTIGMERDDLLPARIAASNDAPKDFNHVLAECDEPVDHFCNLLELHLCACALYVLHRCLKLHQSLCRDSELL
jgi:hypothetical protein